MKPAVRRFTLKPLWPLLAALFIAASGSTVRAEEEPPLDWLKWQQERRESVAGTNGWATLAGLFWLAEGTNTAGAAPTNAIVLPAGAVPESVGSFIRTGTNVTFVAAGDFLGVSGGKPVRELALRSDATNEPTRLNLGRLTSFVIVRGDRIGLRVRDPRAETRLKFEGLDYFPWQGKWLIEAAFQPFRAPRRLMITDVTGATNALISPGFLTFPIDGVTQRLQAFEDKEAGDLFILFRDATSGHSTYGAVRYMHVPLPDSGGLVSLDFNRAYNPPCAFTPFATCPLAPRQNWLPVPIEAGEKRYRGGH